MAHNHDHKSEHAHGPSKFGAAFAIGISLNLAFVIVETVYGYSGPPPGRIPDHSPR